MPFQLGYVIRKGRWMMTELSSWGTPRPPYFVWQPTTLGQRGQGGPGIPQEAGGKEPTAITPSEGQR